MAQSQPVPSHLRKTVMQKAYYEAEEALHVRE